MMSLGFRGATTDLDLDQPDNRLAPCRRAASQRLESVATGSFLEFQFALRAEFAIYFIPMTMPK